MAGNTSSPNDETSPLLRHSENRHAADSEPTTDRVEAVAAQSFSAGDPPLRPLPGQPGECISYQWPPPAAVESDALEQALERLAENLASTAPAGENEWTAQAVSQLRQMQERLKHSSGGKDAPDPFPKEANLAPGLVRRGIKLQQAHDNLLLQARMLLVLLGHEAEDHVDLFDMIRRRFELLLRGLRHYEAGEMDLIFDSVCVDIGTGD